MASNTLLQPVLPALQHAFAGQDAATLVAAATPLGYMLGLVLCAPLSDGRDIRTLIFGQSLGLATMLAVEAVAPSLPVLVGASFIGGAMATVSAHCMALGVRLSPNRRGRAVGIIAMGVSLGMLLSRLVGGVLSERWGWRTAPAVAAGLVLFLSLLVRWRLPSSVGAGEPVGPIRGLQRLIPTFSTTPGLGQSAVIGGCWFAAFSALWAALALQLSGPPFMLGAEAAGAFGILGAGGVVAAQVGGRAVDRLGPALVIKLGLAMALAGFAVLWAFGDQIWGLISGAMLVDMGCFVAQAANQVRVLGLAPDRQGQVYGGYMTAYYGAGAIGAAAGPWFMQHANWKTLCLTAAVGLTAAVVSSPAEHNRVERFNGSPEGREP